MEKWPQEDIFWRSLYVLQGARTMRHTQQKPMRKELGTVVERVQCRVGFLRITFKNKPVKLNFTPFFVRVLYALF